MMEKQFEDFLTLPWLMLGCAPPLPNSSIVFFFDFSENKINILEEFQN